MDEATELLEPKEIAALFEKHPSTIRRWIKLGIFGTPEPAGGGLERKRVRVSLANVRKFKAGIK